MRKKRERVRERMRVRNKKGTWPVPSQLDWRTDVLPAGACMHEDTGQCSGISLSLLRFLQIVQCTVHRFLLFRNFHLIFFLLRS